MRNLNLKQKIVLKYVTKYIFSFLSFSVLVLFSIFLDKNNKRETSAVIALYQNPPKRARERTRKRGPKEDRILNLKNNFISGQIKEHCLESNEEFYK